ncbi:glycoside hydrolase family 2 protein [Nibricoccus aquaticus]|uniref:glycoside hydrolase family 2 protein n=1 Tax=Nibricoccus aquaticus TaxID=2576891 RepID=UPI0015866708|nr:glycoside hydrolase family 2 TIM barrel-domain containing protein [Nibricoccus aquaticus]
MSVFTLVAPARASRSEMSLNERWHFHFGEQPTSDAAVQASADWPVVTLPHTWNAKDGADGGDDYARGEGWYVKTFTVDPAWRGKRVFIEFKGANRNAAVFLNGKSVGEHHGGYARFRFDLTHALERDGENTLAVRVSNAPDGLAPISADFTFFGGIYRGVRLFTTDDVHVDVLDHASDGIYLTQTKVSAERAEIAAVIRLKNDSEREASTRVRTVVRDSAGATVFSRESAASVAAVSGAHCEQTIVVERPRLWDGPADPALYSVTVTVLVDGKIRDEVTQRIGLRSFAVDPEKGFFLNGKPFAAHGVSRHQDRAGKGWAISEEDDREDFALIKEMGATAVRVAHYPQSELWFDLCDEHGMIVWAEIPVVNEVDPTPAYTDNAKQQLRELIRQNYNRPGIFFWGVGNETREMGEGSGAHKINGPAANALIAELTPLVREEDPSRLSVYASHHRPEDVKNFHTDLLGFNKYIGWYGGDAKDFAAWIDGVHQRFRKLKLGVSEYGAGANIYHHDDPANKPAPGGEWHPEEYQSHFHELHWNAMRDREYLWGKFIWNMFDFAADPRSEGAAPGINDKGLITYDRKTKKDAFFWYQANWSKTPVLHIASRRYVERTESGIEVKVYSNAKEVELFVNGVSQGKITSENHLFRWKILLAEGANRIVARGSHESGALSDECVWNFRNKTP